MTADQVLFMMPIVGILIMYAMMALAGIIEEQRELQHSAAHGRITLSTERGALDRLIDRVCDKMAQQADRMGFGYGEQKPEVHSNGRISVTVEPGKKEPKHAA